MNDCFTLFLQLTASQNLIFDTDHKNDESLRVQIILTIQEKEKKTKGPKWG